MKSNGEIESLYVDNFKSLVKFRMLLSDFTCLIGLNGAGKSTILQVFDFISSILQGNTNEWLEARKWKSADLTFKPGRKQSLTLQLRFSLNGNRYIWTCNFNRVRMNCIYEDICRFDVEGDLVDIFSVKDKQYKIGDSESKSIDFNYVGSTLSQISQKVLTEELVSIVKYLSAIRSMDLLSPNLIRLKSRPSDVSDIGLGGEKLSVFFHRLPAEKKQKIIMDMQRYYPQLKSIHTGAIASGWVKFEIEESVQEGDSFRTEARHVNDGFVRLLAIHAQQYSENSFILYDEIENGVNSEVTKMLVDSLLETSKQTLVTTHSPVVLNFLPDDVARKSIVFVYKRQDGVTRAIRLFDVGIASDKLEFLSAGEVVIDIPQSVIADEAEAILLAREAQKR